MATQKPKNTVTKEQIEAWKKKYGTVYEIVVDDKICYLRRPERKALALASVVGQKDPFAYNETILKNCWLAGDEEIKTDDSYFLGISGKLADLIEIKEASIKKL